MPTPDLPLFEGRQVDTLKFTVTGSTDDPNAQPTRPLKIGDTIVTIQVSQVVSVNHTENDGVVCRTQKAKMVEAHEILGKEGIELLNRLRPADPGPHLQAV